MNTGTYRLPDEIHKKLLKLKEAKGIPVSSLIRIAVLDLIKKEGV